ncbi:hypothetical protein CDAR_588361 [Caerostris darwini]|uniref:Uncharacterized protein n=1 Tax=Caerostris darwini TaxID=1538125 RepID=A0AAV4S6Y1_9ARAC|nr:hypothetical protein CDAR_588361 [Caerostris darwini]
MYDPLQPDVLRLIYYAEKNKSDLYQKEEEEEDDPAYRTSAEYRGRVTVAMAGLKGWLQPDRSLCVPDRGLHCYWDGGEKNEMQFYRGT